MAQSRAGALAGAGDLRDTSRLLEQLAARVGPAVVEVITLGFVSSDLSDDQRGLLVAPSRGSGSGVIVDADGYIVTNAHVIEGAHRIQVEIAPPPTDPSTGHSILPAPSRLVPARVIATDEETDLAVIKVDQTGLPTLDFADSDEVKPGQLVLAFGSPMGLNSSVTLGVVSAVARQLDDDDPMIYLQTDAPINPGNSGGPLVDMEGRVVGINTLILSQSGGNEGLGFAAPSNIVRNVYAQIRRFGRVRRGEIGVRAQTVTPLLAEGLHLATTSGVILSDVYPGSTAARAGLSIGDIVLSLDGKPMENSRQLKVNLYSRAVGDTVRLEILRDAKTTTAFVAVAERDDDPTRFVARGPRGEKLVGQRGVLGVTLDKKIATLLPDLRIPTGVVVASTSLDLVPGAEAQLKPGDLIHAVNATTVTSVGELRAALRNLTAGDAAVVQVERDGELLFVGVRISP
jgi:serine protease Do